MTIFVLIVLVDSASFNILYFRYAMTHKFELDFGGNWLKCEGVNISEASFKKKRCHEFALTDEGVLFLTPGLVHLVTGKSMKIPWLFGPATRRDNRTVIYPCSRYRCSLPCPCLLCRRGKTPRCRVTSTQPCDCTDCTDHFLDHNRFHGIGWWGVKWVTFLVFGYFPYKITKIIFFLTWPTKHCIS